MVLESFNMVQTNSDLRWLIQGYMGNQGRGGGTLTPGRYRVYWSVVARDGHRTEARKNAAVALTLYRGMAMLRWIPEAAALAG